MRTLVSVLIVLTALLVGQVLFAKTTLGLNDVSILLPLPKNEDEGALLLKPQNGLIPANILSRLQPLISDDPAQDRLKTLKLISFRIDACFAESTTPVPCRHQLRLIFQPLSYYQNSSLVFDAAVHAFYEFNDVEWASLLKEWKTTLTDASTTTPLQVHPVIKSQGLRGPLWQTYKNILIKYCAPKNLVRVTQSTVDKFGMNWEFSGFDILPNGNFKDIAIPRTQVTKQIFFSNPGDIKEFSAEMTPLPSQEEKLADFFEGSAYKNKDTQIYAVRRGFEFENPQKFNTANLDCVSCHMAQSLRLWGEAHFTGIEKDATIAKNRFFSTRNLEQSVKPFSIINRVRAFGYFFDEANISPRVINESAIAADTLEKYLNP